MVLRKLAFVCASFVGLAAPLFAESMVDLTVIPLTVDSGYRLQVLLTEKLRFKENEPVQAEITEPVYAFDRKVIPSGARVEGKITGFRKGGKWKSIAAKLGGDFTPVREPQIAFHTLILSDGTRIPIETFVGPGNDRVVGSNDEHRPENDRKSPLAAVKKFKKGLLKRLLWGLSPYRPQELQAGTPLSAVLLKPLDFGAAVFEMGAFDEIGSEPSADTIVFVRLITPLDSSTARTGAPVKALLTRPLFSPEQRLILPVGTVLRGHVTKVKAARSRHRNGEIAFSLTTVAPPESLISKALDEREVNGSLVGAHVTQDVKNLDINERGTVQIVESKMGFIAPIWALIKAQRALGANADAFDKALLDAYRGKFLKQLGGNGGSESGFGLPATITGAMIPPVGIGLGFYGAARSVYSNLIGRGRDIILPANTPLEIRLQKVPSGMEPQGKSPSQERTIQ